MLLLDYLDDVGYNNNNRLFLNILGVIVFITVFIGLTGEISSITKSYMNKYIYQIAFLILVYLICLSNKYLGILGFLLFILQFRNSCNEYFTNYNNTKPKSNITKITDDLLKKHNISPSQQPTTSPLTPINNNKNEDIFKLDPVMKQQIFSVIRDQISYDPYKTDLSRQTILDIYKKYFGEDQSLELKKSIGNSMLYQP